MLRRVLGLLVAAVSLLLATHSALALSSPTSPTPAGPQTDPGLILVIVVIPVVLLALVWMGYIFWLLFHKGENVGSGSPPPPEDRHRPPSNRSQEPPDPPGNVG